MFGAGTSGSYSMKAGDFSLMVHGGAGAPGHRHTPDRAALCLEGIRTVLEHGRRILSRAGSALEAVESCAAMLEDDPLFNAGRGSVLNEDGAVEMDAAIMDGRQLAAGAVAAVRNIANPVRLARRIMDDGAQVMLAGEGAMRFARRHGISTVPDGYLVTAERLSQYGEAHRGAADPEGNIADDLPVGTIGAVARDQAGNLAAATSTGGTFNKRTGRVGDSPVVGAGVWADNATCAVSCTGVGEDFIRTALARMAADLIEIRGLDAGAAVREAIGYLDRKVRGRGGLILIDREGRCASAFTTPTMIRGWIDRSGDSVCAL